MATDRDFVDYVHEQTGLGERLTYKRMFGEYALYLDGKVVAFACDNSLFLKPTTAGRSLLPRVTEGPPYPGAKMYLLLDEFLDDGELLQRLVEATAAELPAPKPKKPKAGKATAKKTPSEAKPLRGKR
ncbi:TfoX domain-containing protein [Pseudoxanthomonas kalamensis DSM 18571]|uniref:TfoX/Sxy family protein n=1 Tax=Pseudoxanthomonas kalamensis TaxID=289483 RepID=UPI0013912821|nr:TfoX/Sxy family protein [Pseudoxanthomonas kalamensis]KAF1710023.1 TfoX domain-containing protein [Pseudoxanthomonas kalamensis DSM 18571]